MVQEPETSFAADVTAAKRVLDMQDGAALMVGHSYGGPIITEAGVHPKVVGLVYVAAHAPDVGEDEVNSGRGRRVFSLRPLARSSRRRMASRFWTRQDFRGFSRRTCRVSRPSSKRYRRCWPQWCVHYAADRRCLENQAE